MPPWEKYQGTAHAGPWQKFAAPAAPTLAAEPDIDRDQQDRGALDVLDVPRPESAVAEPGAGLKESIRANKGMMTTTVSPRSEMSIQAQRKALDEKLRAEGKDPARDPEFQKLNSRYAEAERGRVLETAAIAPIPTAPLAKGAAAVVRGATKPAARELLDASPEMRLTPGQQFGGELKATEDKLSSLPFTGGALVKGRRVSIEDLNRELYNRALSPIGLKFEGKDVGRQGVKEVNQKLSDAYDALKPRLTFRGSGAEWQSDLTELTRRADAMGELGKKAKATWSNVVLRNMERGGTMDGEAFKKVESELGVIAREWKSSTLASEREYGQLIEDAQGALRDQLARSNPALAAALEKINSGWAVLTRIQEASSRRAGGNGIISPADLSAAVRKGDGSVRKGAFARGDAMLQDLSEPAQEVLPSGVPDSGSGGRLANMHAIPLAAGAVGYPIAKGYLGVGRALNRAARPGAGEGFPVLPIPLAPDYRNTDDALNSRSPAASALGGQ